MPQKFFIRLLIPLAIIILIAVGFTIIFKNKSLTREVSQIGDNIMEQEKIVRQPAVAGAFYPAAKSELESIINGFLSNVDSQEVDGAPKILIVPHAGYVYSGQVAAYGFKQLQGQGFKKAIIIGPSHNFPASGLLLTGATHWQTPLGLIKIADINSELAKEDNFSINNQAHEPEHSLEVEVPFLQTVEQGIEIVPIIVGQLNSKQQADFVETLNKYLDQETILIVSVDLSHYHPYNEAVDLDNQAIENILNLDSQKILDDEIDAPWAVAAVLELVKKNNWEPKLLKYENSGDVTGDKSRVVGYSAVGFYSQEEPEEQKDEYTQEEKQELLVVARTAIEQYLKDGTIYEPQTDNPKLKEKRGVFVTLNKDGKLRGCIGYIEAIKSIIEAVRDNAISAAVEDNRFSPVVMSEMAEIEIEISILTLTKPDTIESIIKEKKGTVLKQGAMSATYLPQVWDDITDTEEFFTSLCQKGGMPSGCYKDDETEVLSYEAIVFHE